MVCKWCGNELRDGLRFCTKCGHALPQMNIEKGDESQGHLDADAIDEVSIAIPALNAWQQATTERDSQWEPTLVDSVLIPNGTESTLQLISDTQDLIGDGVARVMPTNRGIVKLFLYSVLTLGIYGYWATFHVVKDMDTICDDNMRNTDRLTTFLLKSFLSLGIFSLYCWYQVAERAHANGEWYGVDIPEGGRTYLLWQAAGLLTFGIGGLYGLHVVIRNVNLLSQAYNERMGFE